MFSRPDSRDLVADMIAAVDRIGSRIYGASFEQFAGDQDALEIVSWNFMKLGEAAAQIDDAVKARFPDIEWNRATGIRNRIAHGYRTIDPAILWDTAQSDLPPLLERLHSMLSELG